MGPLRFVAALMLAMVLHSELREMSRAFTVPICQESFQVILIDNGESPATPEPPPLPPPLEDYSEVLGIASVGAGQEPDFATPTAGALETPAQVAEIVATALAENPSVRFLKGDQRNVRVAAVVFAGPASTTDSCAVEVWDREFRPRQTAVKEGTTVYWWNRGGQPHRVKPSGSGICNFDTGVLVPGEFGSHEFDEPAEFPCRYEDPGFDRLHNDVTVCSTNSEDWVCR